MDKSLDVSALSPGFEEVYAKYRTYFVRIAMSYVRDRMAAEDLVTDSFLKVWERRKETTPQHLPSYLLAVLKRNCLNWLRDRSIHIRAHQTLQQTEQRIVNERIVHLESGSPPQELMTSEVLAIIARELRRMPERRRRVFIAHRYEEMAYKDIAAVYSLSESQVTYELRAAREALRIALKDYLPFAAIFVDIL